MSSLRDVLPVLEYELPSYEEAAQPKQSEYIYSKKADDYEKLSKNTGTASNVFRRVKIDVLSSTDTIILVMGHQGAGKTQFLQALAPNLSPQFDSVDIWFLPGLIGPNVAVIILPGVGGTTHMDSAIWEQNAAVLKDMYNRKLTLSGIVYLQPISMKPTSPLFTRNYDAFEKLCGKEAAAGVLLVTTKWDNVRLDLAKQREDHLRSEYWAWLLNHGASLSRFHGTTDSAWKVLRPCFKRRNRYVLKLQRELSAKAFVTTDVGLLVLSSVRHHHRHDKTPNRERDSFGLILNALHGIENACSTMHIPILPGVLSIAGSIVELVQNIKVEDDNIAKATMKWLSLMHTITEQLVQGPISPTLQSALERLLRELEDIQMILERLEFTQMKSMWQRLRAARHTDNQISECNTRIQNALDSFQVAAMLNVDQKSNELAAKLNQRFNELAAKLDQRCSTS